MIYNTAATLSELRVKKSRKIQGIIITVEAVLVTLAFHGIMLLLFSAPEPKPAGQKTKPQRIFMLNFSGKSTSRNADFKYWLKYGDPTMIAIDNAHTGYGAIMRKQGLRMTPPTAAPRADIKQLNFTPPEIPVTTAPQVSLSHEISGVLKYQPMTLELPEPRKLDNPPDYPVWKDSQGKPLLQLFSKADSVRKKVELLKPAGSTVMEVNFSGNDMLPRIKVVTSCGKIELDRLAMRTLFVRFNEIHSREAFPDPAFVITEWRKYSESGEKK